MQLAKNENPPEQSPELIRIGKRNAAADTDVLRGLLLKQIADYPDESAEDQPEDDTARAEQFVPKRCDAGIADCQRSHHSQFTDGKKGDEREWVHPRQIGFAIRNVHGAPENSRAERCRNATERMSCGRLSRRSDGEDCRACAHDERAAQNADPSPPAGLAQFIEEEESPENSQKAIRIPEREGDAQADVADGEDRQRVRDGPQAAGQDGPEDQMGRAAHVHSNGRSAQNQGGQAPASEKDPDDHDE